MPDALAGFLLHPFAVITHILRQPSCTLPTLIGSALPLGFRVHGRMSGKLRRNLNHRLVNHHRHGVQVVCVRFQPQTLCFQRNRAAARERIQQGRRIAVCGLHNLRLGFRQNALVIAVFPFHQPRQNAKQPLTFLLLRFKGGKLLWMVGRIIHQRAPNNSPCCGCWFS